MSGGASDARYEKTLIEVNQEIVRAKRIHGPTDFHSAHEGHSVLLEELDELWDEIKINPKHYISGSDPDGRQEWRYRMRQEAIQVAAMAVRFAAELT